MSNVKLNTNFTQVCVWPGTLVGADKVAEFEQWVQETFNVRVQYLEEVLTAPNMQNGFPVEGTGGRNDLMFAVHDEDVMRFAVPRLQFGMRWLEDMYGNGHGALYPERVAEYQCWDAVE